MYLGSGVRSDAGCTAEVKSRLAMGMAVMIKLTRIWKNKAVSTNTKLRSMKSLVWPVATYGCEAWTLKKEEERRVQAFENKCTRKLLRMSWIHMMNTEKVYQLAGTKKGVVESYQIPEAEILRSRDVMRKPHDTIEASIMTGFVEGVRRQGRQRICWFDNIQARTGLSGTALVTATRDRLYWTALTHPCSQPSRRRTDMT